MVIQNNTSNPPHTSNFRTLVARCQHQVYPSINNDLKDWLESTRLKAAQLLYLMLYHSEQDIVMHTEKVLNCLNMAARLVWNVKHGYCMKSVGILSIISINYLSGTKRRRLGDGQGKAHVSLALCSILTLGNHSSFKGLVKSPHLTRYLFWQVNLNLI